MLRHSIRFLGVTALLLLCGLSALAQTSPIPGNTSKTGWQIACPNGMGTIRSELSAVNPGLYIDTVCVDSSGVVDGGFPAVEYFYSPPINKYVVIGGGSGGGGTVTQCGSNLLTNVLTKGTAANQICSGSVTDNGGDPVFTTLGYSSETGGFWDSYTVGTGGVTAGLTVCEGSSSNSVVTCAAGATSGLIGVAQSTVSIGGLVRVCFVGHCNATEDGTIPTQDWAIMSATVAGELHDSGINVSQPCPAAQQALYTQSGNTGAGASVGVDFLTANDTCRNNSGSGIINPAPQYATAYYSAPGTSVSINGVGPNTFSIPEVFTQANGTIQTWSPLGVPVDNVTGTSYTGLCSDTGRHKIFSAVTSITATLPTANTCTSPAQPNYITLFSATGAGSVVITPTAGTIGKIGGTQGASLTLASGSSGFIYTDSVSAGCTVTACYDVIVDSSAGSGTVTQDTTSFPETLINGTNHVVGSTFNWSKNTEAPNTIWAAPQIPTLPNVAQVANKIVCLGGAGQSTCAAQFPSNVGTNDAILVYESTGNTSTITAAGVTDSLGNTFSVVGTFSQTSPNIFYTCASVAAGSDTVTFTASVGGAPEINITAVEATGFVASGCADANGSSSSSLSVTSSAVSTGNEFVTAYFHDADTTGAPVVFTPAAGYTQIYQYNCTGGGGCSSAHETMIGIGGNSNTGLSGAQTATVTVSGSTTNLSARISTFKLSNTGGIPTFQQLLWATLPVNTTTPTSGDCLNVTGNPNIGNPYQITDAGVPCTGEIGSSTVPAWSIVGFSGSALTLSSTTFLPFSGGGVSSTTETNVDQNSPQASIVSNLFVQVSAAPGTGNSFAFTARKGASSQTLTCTISNSATSCSDTTHSFSTAQGDLLDWQIVPSGTIVVTPNVIISAQWAVNTVQSQSVVTGSRSIGTVFQNTGQKPLYVEAVTTLAGTTGCADFLTDSSNPPTTQTATQSTAAGATTSLFIIVLPGNFYKLNNCSNGSGTATLSVWVEWQ